MARQTLNNLDGAGSFRTKLNANFTELYDTVPANEERLTEWAQGKDYEPLVITRDSEGRVTTMTVKWPDTSAGTYVATDYNATHEVYDGYAIIHVDSGLTVTQAAVTRNSDGAITNKPALTVA
jgi:hypothetical protein